MPDGAPDADLNELVAQCLLGDQGALCTFVRRFERAVFGLCLRMLGDRHEAEDVAQETFLRAVRNLDRWDRDRPLLPWIQTIAANRCRTALSKRILRAKPVGDPPELAVGPAVDDLTEEVEMAVSQLPESWQSAVRMHYQGGLNCQQIAEALDCAEGTVKTWLFRGRRQLASIFEMRGLSLDADWGART